MKCQICGQEAEFGVDWYSPFTGQILHDSCWEEVKANASTMPIEERKHTIEEILYQVVVHLRVICDQLVVLNEGVDKIRTRWLG